MSNDPPRLMGNALSLPLLYFLHCILGFLCFPVGMIYADQPQPLDQVIAHMNSLYWLPTPQILFIGDPELATPHASALYLDSPDFLNQMLDEQRKRQGFYGLVIVQARHGEDPVRFSQLTSWANALVANRGFLVIYDFHDQHYQTATRKDSLSQ